MSEEKAGDEVKAVEVQIEEVKTPSPQEELVSLRQRLVEVEKEKATAQEEAKAHQKVVSKKDQELQEVQRKADDISELKERLEIQEAYLAELAGKDNEGVVQKFKTEQQQRHYKSLMDRRNVATAKITELIKGTGLNSDSPELETARVYFERADRTGDTTDYDKALRKVEEAVSKIIPKEVDKKVETEEVKVERLVNERLKQKMVEKGLLAPEGGEPSAAGGRTFTRQQIADMPMTEYAKNKEAIDQAMREGRIK